MSDQFTMDGTHWQRSVELAGVDRLVRAVDRTLPFERWINVGVVAAIARAYENDEPRNG